MKEIIEKTKKNEMSDFKACTEMKKDIDTNLIRSRWYFMWLNRRKILATAVIVLPLLIVCFFYLLCEDLLSKNIDDSLISFVASSLIWLAGIMSLWLVSIELIAVLREKPFLKTTRIHLILITILLICELLIIYTDYSEGFIYFFGGMLLFGFLIEVCLCTYEAIIHLIEPIIELCKDDYSSIQKCKTITRASFYAFAYIIGDVVSVIFLLMVILMIIDPFANVDEYGDVYYNYGTGGVGLIVMYSILPIILILSTFSMKIFHNEIIKRSHRQFNNRTIEQSKK